MSPSSSTPAASAGFPTRTSTARTIPPMPGASGTKPMRFGLATRIFVGCALLVVAVLGATFGVTTLRANRTADESIHRALVATRRALSGGALSGSQTQGAWLDDVAHKLFVAVATPLAASAQATPQGVLVAAYALDDSLAQAVKQATNSDVVFFALDTVSHPFVVGST